MPLPNSHRDRRKISETKLSDLCKTCGHEKDKCTCKKVVAESPMFIQETNDLNHETEQISHELNEKH